MKKNLYVLMALLFSCSLFIGCSDKDKEKEEEEEEEEVIKVNATYGGDSGNTLKLTYSDEELLGKEIEFYTSTKKTATIKLHYVIPGEETTELTGVVLTTTPPKDDDDENDEDYESDYEYEYFFEGTVKSSTGWNLVYNGWVAAKGDTKEMTFDAEATMPGNTLVGTWALDTNTPVYADWQSGQSLTIGTFVNKQLGISESVLKPTEEVGKLLQEFEVGSLLQSVFKSVTFLEDGNIIGEYSKAGASGWTKSPLNLVHYYVADDEQIRVILNPTALLNEIDLTSLVGGGSGISMEDITKLLAQLSDLLNNGIPVGAKAGTSLQIYLEQELLEELLANQTLVALLGTLSFEIHYPIELPQHGLIPGELEISIADILKQLPEIFEETSVFEIGIVLDK